ncbi:hypothetical protein [Roseateles sp.]|uniref:hypothetical protein n=1 Tax=Roseateles sp. TaxID=1971397 RepID=UPI0040370FCF
MSTPMTMSEFAERVKALLRTQPTGTGLKDGDTDNEFFMDGESLFWADLVGNLRDAGDLDKSAWDSARGCWDGSTPEATMAVIESPVFLPARRSTDLRVEWERDVTDAVAELCECGNSDAQAIVEGQGAILESCWLLRNTAADTAAQITAGSAV